jgi:hypothetical protein
MTMSAATRTDRSRSAIASTMVTYLMGPWPLQ